MVIKNSYAHHTLHTAAVSSMSVCVCVRQTGNNLLEIMSRGTTVTIRLWIRRSPRCAPRRMFKGGSSSKQRCSYETWNVYRWWVCILRFILFVTVWRSMQAMNMQNSVRSVPIDFQCDNLNIFQLHYIRCVYVLEIDHLCTMVTMTLIMPIMIIVIKYLYQPKYLS